MSYIGNKNTKRLHSPNCRAVPMIAPKHIVYTESGEGFYVYCHWCGNQGYPDGGRQVYLENYGLEVNGIERCFDKKYVEVFDKVGCIDSDGEWHKGKENNGIVLMYPHDDGVEVQDKPGRWWIYYQCEVCGYQTSLHKAIGKLARMNRKDGV